MKERPILFSGAMVRAILDGTKTQTRRVVKPQPVESQPGYITWKENTGRGAGAFTKDAGWWFDCPYGAIGDRLWVRETWKPWPNTAGPELRGPDGEGAIYRATWDKSGGHHWKPSIFLPRALSRITLEITGVRVERVQDISEGDARAEGVEGLLLRERPDGHYEHVALTYQHLWDEINAKRGYGWEVNPYVWVVEFKKVEEAT